MLILLFALAVAPQTAARPPVTLESPRSTAPLTTFGLASPQCNNRAIPTEYPVAPGGGLMWRDGDTPVRMYRLLERRVNGCSAPIVVMDRVPGSNALGREVVTPGTDDRPSGN